tara:strand:+ start:490 stop:732 length:243 start_codon:yes stop_codon:yes gene_type:complete
LLNQLLIGEMPMSYLMNLKRKISTPKSKKFELYVLRNKDTSPQNKQYKHKKEELRMKHNNFLLNLNSSHANDYDIFNEVA